MYFIGVDLGWKDKYTTGVAVLDDNLKVKSLRVIKGADLFKFLGKYLGETGVIAIDAPLTVGKGKGKMRLYEKFLTTKPFRRWKVQPLPPALIWKLPDFGIEVSE